jgi:hypothetical protein
MIYIRPPVPVTPKSVVKPVSGSELVQEQVTANLAEVSVVVSEAQDRRKQKDRRNESKDPLLETRVNRERRRSDKASISIIV